MIDDIAEKAYVPFIVNRGLSYFYDTVLLANEMNFNHHLDNRMQFDFLRNTVRKKRRYGKWNKANSMDKVDSVMKFYNVSTRKAEQILPLLSDEQVTRIEEILSQGGKKR